MIDLKPPNEKESEITNVLMRVRESSRALMNVSWLRPLARAPAAAAKEMVGRVERVTTAPARAIPAALASIPPILLSFFLLVLAPSFAVTLYFALFASDQFSVESRFAVRSVEVESAQSEGASGGVASSVGFSFTATGQNAYIVTSYIRSRAIVDDISQELNLREIFRRPEADFWARLERNASIDELTDYWLSMVDTYVDSLSGVVTVRLRAFRRDDALALGRAVVKTSEALVNRISDRARRDATTMAEKEVRRAFASVQVALADLHNFRDTAGIIDPGQTMGEIGKLLIPLMSERIKIESELFVATREMSADAPTVRLLQGKLEAMEAHIKELKAKITSDTGATGRTVAGSLAKFEELEIQRQLAERFYALAQADLDRAQLRANRQNVYLSVFVLPSLPEESRFPRRIAFSILTFVALAVVWAIIVMIIASVEDHRL
jgi:capsular polysaccharide transport system permease protein